MAGASHSPVSGTRSSGWLFSPAIDLSIGCGLASIMMLAAQGIAGPQIHNLVPGALLVLAFSLPHYGATLLRVYEHSGDRRRYSLFSIYASALLAGLFVAGLQNVFVGSLILTLYLTWSPWHYTGQNYGIFLMLLGRRGVPVSPLAKRFIYASFILSFVVTLLAIHGVERSGGYAPVSYESTVYHLMPIGIPGSVARLGVMLAGLGYVVSLGVAVALLLRAGSVRAIGPSLVIAGTQSLWFCVPVLLKNWVVDPGSASLQSMYGAYGFLWIAAAHAAQYLWITAYYAKSADQTQSTGRFLAKAAMAGFAIWTLPALIFAPGLLGRLPHESGLALMVAATVNLHHFVLDGAIWKLRDGRLARILLPQLSTAGDSAPDAPAQTGRRWLRTALLGLGAASIVYGGITLGLEEYGFKRALQRGDLGTARSTLERFAWLGRDSPSKRAKLGMNFARLGERRPAEREFRRSIQLHPNFEAWQSLALLYEEAGELPNALSAYQAALELKPDDVRTLYRMGVIWLSESQPERAIELLERATQLAPNQSMIRVSLLRARREAAADD